MSALAFIDTETTSLRADRRAWEVGLILRRPDKPDEEHHWFVAAEDLDLGNADPFSLSIGRFYERHPQPRAFWTEGLKECPRERAVLADVERLTRGAHLVGAVVSFDADVLGQRMRANGLCPSWHYHLIDVEALAVGWLNGRRARQNEIVDGYPLENNGEHAPGLVRWNSPGPWDVPLPWKSDDLSRLVGVTPAADEDRHTALGDAKWAMRIYDAVMGNSS